MYRESYNKPIICQNKSTTTRTKNKCKNHTKTVKDKDNEQFCKEVLSGDYTISETVFENICKIEL